MALALYRRYRPDTFDGVIGQDQVTIPLSRALDEDKLTHAYLFSGPRGCGKTSSARIFARGINCAKGPTSHPCGQCDSCKDLATGGPGSIDVVEIDAASHNGVDDARELRERASFAPVRDRYKIFILDEAHMVTQQGFNALLKIVEEPPEHVMFIFATTEAEKVIGTIRSRTHHYPFRLVPQEVMGPYLEKICTKEGIRTEPGVLKMTMRAGGGSVRDTLSVLDQLMVGAVDGSITYDSAVALLGFTPETLISKAVDTLIAHDGAGLYGVIQKVIVGGFEPQRFVEDLLARLRDMLVLKLAGTRAESVLGEESDEDQLHDLHRQADALDLPRLNRLADTVDKTLSSMKGATSPRMRLELLAARLLAIGCEPVEGEESPGRQRPDRNTQPVHSSGFIGSTRPDQGGVRQGVSQDGNSQGGNQPVKKSAPDLPQSPTMKVGSPSRTVGDGQGEDEQNRQSQSVSDSSSPAIVAGSDQTEDNLDKRWDDLVASLPSEVREYVVRSKVPSVSLRAGSSGRQMLALTFDKPLSQHAFAMGVASEEVDGETAIPRIVMVRARHEFGKDTMIAPSGTAANGEKVESVKRMSPQRRAEVKKEVALARASLSAVSLGSSIAHHMPRETANSEGKSEEVGTGEGDQTRTGDDAEDGHHRDAQPVHSLSSPLPAAGFGSTDSDLQGEEEDPWAIPQSVEPSEPLKDSPSVDIPQKQVGKAVPLPDLTDKSDPWAQPVSAVESIPGNKDQKGPGGQENLEDQPGGQGDASSNGDILDGGQESNLSQEPDGWGDTRLAVGADGSADVKEVHDQSQQFPSPPAKRDDYPLGFQAEGKDPADGSNQHESGGVASSDPSPAEPEEDDYSLDDARLNADRIMGQDELAKMFEVTKVENFAASDPANPLNVLRRKQERRAGE